MLLRAVYCRKLAKLQGTRTDTWPADHTQRPAGKNWHPHYFLHASCDFRLAVNPQGTRTKNLRYPCILLACHRFKMVGKCDLQTITGQVRVPYFPLASQYMIPKHVRAECVKCTTAVLEAHLARTTRKSHVRSNIQFSYGWWAARKLVARATCSISTTHFQPPRKHYVLYRQATANKSAEPVCAKSRTTGCKASYIYFSFHKTLIYQSYSVGNNSGKDLSSQLPFISSIMYNYFSSKSPSQCLW